MAAPLHKAHTSALCLIPPRSVWDSIQSVRFHSDRNFIRWPPHINLLYPFVADQRASLQQAAQLASDSLQRTRPFELTLDEVSYFQHSASCTIWLGSSSCPQLMDLQAGLQAAFPEFDELTLDPERNIRGFRPHLSLGQWTPQQVEQSLQDIKRDYKPVTFTVDSVEVISREGQTQPFRVRYRVPLGGGAAEEVNVPYIASVNPPAPISTPLAKRYGLGAVTDGVWYFAFGANMSKKKLTGSRGITALESLPAKLPGWTLDFNHRGAMGNLMELESGEVGPCGLAEAHGVLHRVSSHDFALLSGMEHEYRPTEVMVERYDGGDPIAAIAFISPPDRRIPKGLPPTIRYADLLREGADEFQLNAQYRAWLRGLPTVPSESKRGDEYWTGLDGQPMKMYSRIWKGSEGSSHRGRGGRGGRGGGGRGRGRSQHGRGGNSGHSNMQNGGGEHENGHRSGGRGRGGGGGRGRFQNGSYAGRGGRSFVGAGQQD